MPDDPKYFCKLLKEIREVEPEAVVILMSREDLDDGYLPVDVDPSDVAFGIKVRGIGHTPEELAEELREEAEEHGHGIHATPLARGEGVVFAFGPGLAEDRATTVYERDTMIDEDGRPTTIYEEGRPTITKGPRMSLTRDTRPRIPTPSQLGFGRRETMPGSMPEEARPTMVDRPSRRSGERESMRDTIVDVLFRLSAV